MKTYNVWINNEKKPMTYEDICHELDISPEIHFVKVTTAGTIGFTIGKPDEIRFLLRMCKEKGFRPSRGLKDTIL